MKAQEGDIILVKNSRHPGEDTTGMIQMIKAFGTGGSPVH